MSNCPTCKESILSQTESLIGKTQCTQPCPPEITCVDIIPSNCVFYSGPTLSCPSGSTSVNYGVTITEALNTMYQLICQNSTSNTVQITANDTCYGFLASKITSTSLDITIANPGACEKLNIEEKCWTWNTVRKGSLGDGIFKLKWSSAPNYQIVQYSNVKECVVKLRGTAKVSTYFSTQKTIFTLPFGKRPASTRRYSVHVSDPSGITPLLPRNIGFIYIYAITGDVVLELSQLLTVAIPVEVSLDGIEFEIN
jgi:hypothetical protein